MSQSSELARGDLHIVGRIMPASNHTYAAELPAEDGPIGVVYKPISGEKPLWDFESGTLAYRERAAYLVSESLDWQVVPETILRDGPAGEGMVQRWCEPTPGVEVVDLIPSGRVPDGMLHVLDALDEHERPVSLVHEDSAELRRLAAFDVITNNTDRKAGHILPMADGRRLGVDHGICFHTDDKLRTVLWGFAGQFLTPEETSAVEALLAALDENEEFGFLLTERELDRTRERARRLAEIGFPHPAAGWPSIPWPPF